MALSRARPGQPGWIRSVSTWLAALAVLILQQAAGGGREIKAFEVARAQRLEQHLKLLGRRLSGVDDDEVFFAQPAGAAARAIADLAQQPLAPDLHSHSFGRRRQLFDQRCDSRTAF